MTLKYVLLLRLEEMALRRVVVMLWNQMDILSHFGFNDFNSSNYFNETFHKDVEVVQRKLSKLELPDLQLHKAKPLTEIVGLKILKWLNFHLEFLRFPHTYFERVKVIHVVVRFDAVLKIFSWTSVGSINYEKTAEEIIRCEMFDYFVLYKLACLYCLEDQVPVLWDKLPDTIKMSFYDEQDVFQLAQSHLDAFWTNVIRYPDLALVHREPFDNIANFYQHAFEVSANMGSKAATKYFYEKLTHEQKEDSLFNRAMDVAAKEFSSAYDPCKLSEYKHTDVLCYLLSCMSPETQMELFQVLPYEISICFLVWPWQDLFLDVSQLTLEFLPEDSYCLLLHDIWTETISRDTKVVFFREIFRRSPENLKNYFIDQECFDGEFLYKLFAAEKVEIITLFFKNIENAAKLRLVFCDQGYDICCYLMQEDKWTLLNSFIYEAVLSKNHRDRLKGDWLLHISEFFTVEGLRCKLAKWEQSFFRSNKSNRET